MAGELTTRYLFKLHAGLGNLNNDQNAYIDQLITQSSSLIAEACNRTFALTSYKRWLDGSGAGRMVLPEYPIVSLYRVSTCSSNVMDLTWSGGTHADVSFDGVKLSLHTVTSSGVEATDETITVALYPIVSEMVTAINLLSGWTATAHSGKENQSTLLIRPVRGRPALSPACTSIDSPDEGFDVAVAAISDRVIEVDSSGLSGFGTAAVPGYFDNPFNTHYNRCAYGSGFPSGRANVFVWWRAGYTLPVDNGSHTALSTAGDVPGGLTLVTNQIVQDIFNQRDEDANMNAESEGDGSFTRDSFTSAIERHWHDLSHFAKMEI
jgi:hypothetical protein